MTKQTFTVLCVALVAVVFCTLSAMAIPTTPGPYQRAVNDRLIKIRLLEARALPGSFSIDLPIREGEIHNIQWKDEEGELFKATFILTDNGEDSPAGHGFSGDFVPVANWYEVGE